MKLCPACIEDLPDDAQFCGLCGFRMAPLQLDMTALPRGIEAPPRPPEQLLSPDDTGDNEASGQTTGDMTSDATQPPLHGVRGPRPPFRVGEDLEWVTTERRAAPAHRQDEPPRRFRRYPLKVEVSFSSEHTLFSAQAENISTGGLFIATDEVAEIGDELVVSFSLPLLEGTQVARCKVAWVREADVEQPELGVGLGLHFLDLDPKTAAAVRAFVKHRDPTALQRPGSRLEGAAGPGLSPSGQDRPGEGSSS